MILQYRQLVKRVISVTIAILIHDWISKFVWQLLHGVRLYRWSVVMDELQLAAAQHRQDWSPSVFLQLSSASDPDHASPNWSHFHSAGFLHQGSWHLPWRWCWCYTMFSYVSPHPTDLQRAAFSVSNTYPYSCCEQGRLLLLRVG